MIMFQSLDGKDYSILLINTNKVGYTNIFGKGYVIIKKTQQHLLIVLRTPEKQTSTTTLENHLKLKQQNTPILFKCDLKKEQIVMNINLYMV